MTTGTTGTTTSINRDGSPDDYDSDREGYIEVRIETVGIVSSGEDGDRENDGGSNNDGDPESDSDGDPNGDGDSDGDRDDCRRSLLGADIVRVSFRHLRRTR